MDERSIVGCMTGTSLDGLDVALVRVRGRGREMHAEFVRGGSFEIGGCGGTLRRLAGREPVSARDIAAAARTFALAHAEAVLGVCGGRRPDLVAVHGQTVVHEPPISWQLLNPAPIALVVGSPVVFDLRAADLARGGQGAPITPFADWIFFRDQEAGLAVVNLGGFANATILPGGEVEHVRGFDICACNQVLDCIARGTLERPFDEDGAMALGGRAHAVAAGELGGILEAQRRGRRSLGTGDEGLGWVERWRGRIPGPDLAASACEAIGTTIAGSVGAVERIALAGGGAKNRALVGAISAASRAEVVMTDSLGLPGTYREAAAMAVLGALCQDRVPITLPGVTGVGAPAPISGAWMCP